MSEQYDNELRGVLFKNNRRVKESQPEYTGNCQIGGKEFWVSAWVKTSKDGNKFFSMAYTEKNQEAPPSQGEPVNLDDIPF